MGSGDSIATSSSLKHCRKKLNKKCVLTFNDLLLLGEFSWPPIWLRLDNALRKEHIFKGGRSNIVHTISSPFQNLGETWILYVYNVYTALFIKLNFQGTYLDTILPRADIPQNQVSEHHRNKTLKLYTGSQRVKDNLRQNIEEDRGRKNEKENGLKTRQNTDKGCQITHHALQYYYDQWFFSL